MNREEGRKHKKQESKVVGANMTEGKRKDNPIKVGDTRSADRTAQYTVKEINIFHRQNLVHR